MYSSAHGDAEIAERVNAMRAFDQLGIPSADQRICTSSFPDSGAQRDDAPADGRRFVYDLRIDGQSSGRFYSDVADFSVRVVGEIDARADRALDGYTAYLTQIVRESPRSRGEYALELLTVGMVFRLYDGAAATTAGWVLDLARELFRLRRRSTAIKRVADFLRAGLFQFFMRTNCRAVKGAARKDPAAEGQFAHFPRLIGWLQATGEFEQEWRSMENWRGYLSGLSPVEAENWISVALDLFDWFKQETDLALGKYTAGVNPFLENAYAMRFWREDQLFCGRRPVEYHLGMVAAEVMNEGLREGFQSRPRKVVLVPGCMRGARIDTCKAVTRGLDITCAGCDPDCAVNRITRRMRHEGIGVYIVPHSSGFSRWLERWQNDPKVGLAAVACMMNILAGGYEMRARGIASQCVPLDFPGCEKHWSDKAVSTSLNEDQLVQIVTAARR